MTDQSPPFARLLGDSFAVAILQWPAIILAIELDGGGWEFAARIALGCWAAIVALGITFGRREGPRWGLALTLSAACATALWLTVPTLWALVWFAALMLTFHAAIWARFEDTRAFDSGTSPSPDETRRADQRPVTGSPLGTASGTPSRSA